MAKQRFGITDGFRGSVGPVIGYQWRGQWCLRAKPRRVHNPQTAAQQEHRLLFRDMVRLASHMLPVLRMGLYQAAVAEHMTEGNLFVKMNKDLFAPQGVDYRGLALSTGPVAPVEFTAAGLDVQGVLRVEFEKNPLHVRADSDDEVRVYVYCPALRRGVMSGGVARRARRMQMALPDEFLGCELHCYGFVRDADGRTSETLYIDLDGEEGAMPEPPASEPGREAPAEAWPAASGMPHRPEEACPSATAPPPGSPQL